MRPLHSTLRRYCRLLLENGTCRDQAWYKKLRDECPRPASLYPLLPACIENALSPAQTSSKPYSQFADWLFAGAAPDSSANQLVCHSVSQTESEQGEEVHLWRC